MAPSPSASAAARAVAWLGGALFAGALVTGAWWFAVRLAAPGPAGVAVGPAVAWNVLLFTVFATHHSLLARSGAKAWISRVAPGPLERSLYVWAASLLFLAVCFGWRRVPGVLYDVAAPARWGFVLVQAAGVVLTLAGARVLDGLDLAGIRDHPRGVAVHARAAPHLSGLGANGGRRHAHDARPRRVRGREHPLPGHRHTLGGA
jgi:hypothetical protein